MAKPSWGNKRTCNCGIRFYDLNKKQIECPGCGQTVDVELLSISTLENNLRKKSQTQVIEEKNVVKDKKNVSSNKGQDVEIADEDTKIEVEEITGEKINKVKSEEKKEE
ncbi:MAG: FYDLN acid domain-containing protein [Alphaproteobacteria bacterium]|nr:FYDLN acid domain-containing protein [Alphaproteobacteria bacterium]